jgi:hypothetical protein
MDLRSRSGSVGRSSVTVMQTFGAEQCRSLPGQNQVQNGIRALVLDNLRIPYLRHSPRDRTDRSAGATSQDTQE